MRAQDPSRHAPQATLRVPRTATFRIVNHVVRAVLTCLVVHAALGGCSKNTESGSSAETIAILDADLTFELPATWVELDPEAAREAATDDALMAELVERHGPDTKKFGPVQIFISTAGVPLGPEPIFIASAKGVENDVLSQMTVSATSLDELPTFPELEKFYRKGPIGITYLDLDEIDTDVGPALLAGFSSTLRDPVIHQADLLLDTSSGVFTIYIRTNSRADSEKIAMDIAGSLERTS